MNAPAKAKHPSIVLPEGRANYVHLTKPRPADEKNKEPAYTVTLAWSKKVDVGPIKKAILQAAKSKWGDKALEGLKKGFIASPLRDGDALESQEYRGMHILTARRKESLGPPSLVDGNIQPILTPTEIYSGMFCNVSASFFPYEVQGKKGVGVGLNNVQKTKDGERLAGKPDPKNEFKVLESEGDDSFEEQEGEDDIPF